MNITVVCDVLGDENNGTTIAAMNLIRGLKQRGHSVRVVCPDARRADQPGFFIVPILHLGPLDKVLEWNQIQLAKRDADVLAEAMAGADVVHVMLPFALGKCAAKMAHEQGIPLTAGFHMMSENFTAHLAMQNVRLLNRLTYRSFDPLYSLCDAIHYPTQYLRDLYESMVGPTNGYVISNGVSAAFHKIPAEKSEAWRDRDVILFTGRYSREKSHATLIDAVAQCRRRDRIQLVFAGDGPLKSSLMARAESLPVPPVFQFYARDELLRIINCADLYVHPAEIEAEGIACLEAIACGLVPIISDSPRCATKSYALTDRNAFRYDDPADLAAKIDWWLDHPAERAECSRQYEAYSRDNLALERCMDRMAEMMTDVVAAKNGHTAQ